YEFMKIIIISEKLHLSIIHNNIMLFFIYIGIGILMSLSKKKSL
ncbi:unnamed protein product, partial [marine sediment metagenome]